VSITCHEEVRGDQDANRVVNPGNLRASSVMVDQDGDCRAKTSIQRLLECIGRELTLHPAFPLVRLLSIEETKVFVGSLDSPESGKQSQEG
jgi:hypothetical protein